MTFWETPDWLAYEVAYGDAPGTRAKLLASATWQTQVIDLSLSEADLWRDVRHSYRSLIHRRENDVRRIASHLAGRFATGTARSLHAEVAGRHTRSLETWELMGEWARQDKADFWIVRRIGETFERFVAYVYVVMHDDWSYYFSSVSLEPNLGHALIWTAMRSLKARGVCWFELGWLARDGDTDKDRAISFFKRGWGGTTMLAREAPFLCDRSCQMP